MRRHRSMLRSRPRPRHVQWWQAGVVLALVIALQHVGAAAAGAATSPYDAWNVDLHPWGSDARVLRLDYDSPTLHRRVTNTVYLPSSYRSTGSPSPVVYALHGTVVPQLDNHLLDPVTQQEALLHMISAGGGYLQNELFDFGSTLDAARYIVVAPDTDPAKSWCQSCAWFDGRPDALPNVPPLTAETVAADTFLNRELTPLVQSLFNTRTDRGGRGVIGFSMGGWSAMLQAMKHPDLYGFAASFSGVYDVLREPEFRAIAEAVGYFRDQGYGTSLTDEVWWENFNPADISGNLTGVDLPLVLSAGGPCVTQTPACDRYPPLLNPLAAHVEDLIIRHFAIARDNLATRDVPATFVRSPGVHGANNSVVYRDDVLPAANAAFARTIRTPDEIDYRAAEPSFEVWGYHVDTQRAAVRTTALQDARLDGRSFRIQASSETVEVTTPPSFAPGTEYTVTQKWADGRTSTARTTSDASGRIHVAVTFGSAGVVGQILGTSEPAVTVTVG